MGRKIFVPLAFLLMALFLGHKPGLTGSEQVVVYLLATLFPLSSIYYLIREILSW